MHIEIQSTDAKLSGEQSVALAQRVRTAFSGLARQIVRIVVRVSVVSTRGHLRACEVEVQGRGGEVAIVQERQRHHGVLLRRAVERARRLSHRAHPAHTPTSGWAPQRVRSASPGVPSTCTQ